jgi:subtilisin family serine protease
MVALLRGVLIAAALALVAPTAAPAGTVEVIVRLDGPGLAEAVEQSRALSPAAKQRRLELGAASSRAYLRELDTVQAKFERELAAAVPSARARWRYRIVLNGVAVVVAERDIARLRGLPRVRDVLPNATYASKLDQSPSAIGASTLWNDSLATRGDGMKIGILDDGVDHTHPFFTPNAYAPPAGFPRGQVAFTSSKVIVARAFAPPGASWPHANEPFDPDNSGHGTHVAGIAAGQGSTFSGVARNANIMSVQVFSRFTGTACNNAGENPCTLTFSSDQIAGLERVYQLRNTRTFSSVNMSFGGGRFTNHCDSDSRKAIIDNLRSAGIATVISLGQRGLHRLRGRPGVHIERDHRR